MHYKQRDVDKYLTNCRGFVEGQAFALTLAKYYTNTYPITKETKNTQYLTL